MAIIGSGDTTNKPTIRTTAWPRQGLIVLLKAMAGAITTDIITATTITTATIIVTMATSHGPLVMVDE